MKNILLVAILSVSCVFGLMAQPGGGGRGGRPPGGGGNGGPRGGQTQIQQEDQIGIMRLPEIPDLTEKQREKLIKNISDEKKSVRKLMKDKRELEFAANDPYNGIDPDKQAKKIEKIDKKIKKTEDKYDKKVRKILTEEQYAVFSVKKEEIEFTKPRERRQQGNRRPQRDLNEGDDNQSPPPPPDSSGGWGSPDEF